jgi:hypothetical protein
MVTAEIAVALPALVVLVAAALTAVSVVGAQLRCVDSAREVARALARGESTDYALSLGKQDAPQGAAFDTTRSGDRIIVRVSARARALGGVLPAFTVSATAVTLAEADEAASGAGRSP